MARNRGPILLHRPIGTGIIPPELGSLTGIEYVRRKAQEDVTRYALRRFKQIQKQKKRQEVP